MSKTIAFVKSFPVLWADLDPNGHMRGARYLEYAAEMPFHFLLENGFDFRLFAQEQVGPATLEQSIQHRKEARFGDVITIDHSLRGMSTDASRWAFRHRIVRSDGEPAALVEVKGAFFSLTKRTLSAPPKGVAELIGRLPKAEDYEELATN